MHRRNMLHIISPDSEGYWPGRETTRSGRPLSIGRRSVCEPELEPVLSTRWNLGEGTGTSCEQDKLYDVVLIRGTMIIFTSPH